jgi:hypothetical protein
MSNSAIEWTETKCTLGELLPWARNPRRIGKKEAGRLLESFTEFGQVEPLVIGPDDELYNGHQRLHVLLEQYGPDYEVDARRSSRPLTEKLTVYLHKGATGEWDFEALNIHFQSADLLEWGFTTAELGIDSPIDDAQDAGVDNVPEQWAVMVQCGTETEQADLLQRLESEGYSCRALIS